MKKVSHDSNLPERPLLVKIAISLICASLAIGVVRSILGFFSNSVQSLTAFNAIVIVLSLATTIFLVVMVARGRDWARIVFLILLTTDILGSIPAILHEFAASPLARLIDVGEIALQVIAIVLLFQSPSNAWFRQLSHSQNRVRPLSLCSVATGLLAWRAFSLATYLIHQVWFPVPPLRTIAELERIASMSLWLQSMIPALLAITACLSGIMAMARRKHTSRPNFALAIVGTALGGGFFLAFCGLAYIVD